MVSRLWFTGFLFPGCEWVLRRQGPDLTFRKFFCRFPSTILAVNRWNSLSGWEVWLNKVGVGWLLFFRERQFAASHKWRRGRHNEEKWIKVCSFLRKAIVKQWGMLKDDIHTHMLSVPTCNFHQLRVSTANVILHNNPMERPHVRWVSRRS